MGTIILAFAKKGSIDFIALRTGDFTDGVGMGQIFNLATGAVGTTYANHTASIEKYPMTGIDVLLSLHQEQI